MQNEESIEDVLFVPNDYYIRLLIEFNGMSRNYERGKPVNIAYKTVRKELTGIEIKMPVADIIRNTKLAFKK